MARRDPNTLDFTQRPLCLAADLRFWPVKERGELVYRIEIPSLHRFFRVGYQEYVLMSLLDGKTTIPQACGLAAAKLGVGAPSSAEATTIAKWLITQGLAHFASDSCPDRRRDHTLGSSASSWKWLERFNPFWIKIPLPHFHTRMRIAIHGLRPLFGTPATMLGLILLLVAAGLLTSHWSEFTASSAALFLPGNWFGMVVAWLILKVIHELAHATVCERMGGEMTEAGVVFLLGAPLAYVDVSSCWRMSSRGSRIAVSAAGMYVELLVAAIAVVIWTQSDSPAIRFLMYQVFVTAGVSTLLFNANILMRFDGYFIFADLIDVPNLSGESNASLRGLLRRIVTGHRVSDRSLAGWRYYVVLLYGVLAMLWRMVVCISLVIAASAMFAGAGVVLAVIGIAFWLAGPTRMLVAAVRSRAEHGWLPSLRPIVVSVAMIVAAAWSVFFFPVPTSIRVPAVVAYLPETTLRSRVDGFVAKIHVAHGDTVNAGDPLLEIENFELVHELENLELKRQQIESRLRGATESHDSSLQQVLREDLTAVTRQIQPLRERVGSLSVVASRSGQVIAPSLANQLGEYIHEGDTLLVVAFPRDKELVAVIEQENVEQARAWLHHEVRFGSDGFATHTGRLQRIEPRASDQLPAISLAVSEGGTLAVRSVGDAESPDSLRLLQPVFRGRIAMSPAAADALPVGMRISTSLGYQTQPLAARWIRSVRKLWYASR